MGKNFIMSGVAPYSKGRLYGRYLRQASVDLSLSWHTPFRILLAAFLSVGVVDFLRFYQLPHYSSFTQQPSLLVLLFLVRSPRRNYIPLPLGPKVALALGAFVNAGHGMFLMCLATTVHLVVIDSWWLLLPTHLAYLGALFIAAVTTALCMAIAESYKNSFFLIPALTALPSLWVLMQLGVINSSQQAVVASLPMAAGSIWALFVGRPKPKRSGIILWQTKVRARPPRSASRQIWRDTLTPQWLPIAMLPMGAGLAFSYFQEQTLLPSIVVGTLGGLVYVTHNFVFALRADMLRVLPITSLKRMFAAAVNGWLAILTPLITYLALCEWAPSTSWFGPRAVLITAIAAPNWSLIATSSQTTRGTFHLVTLLGSALVFVFVLQRPSGTQFIALSLAWMVIKDGWVFAVASQENLK